MRQIFSRPVSSAIVLICIVYAGLVLWLVLGLRREILHDVSLVFMVPFLLPALYFVLGAVFLLRGSRVARIALGLIFTISGLSWLMVSASTWLTGTISATNVAASSVALGVSLVLPAYLLAFSKSLGRELSDRREARRRTAIQQL